MTKKQVGEERVNSAFISISLFITKGSQDRNSNRARNLEAGVDEETIDRGCYLLV